METSPDTIREVFEFARQTAKDEIEAIERLHKRTLISLGITLGGVSVVFTLLGWIGYTNLRTIAVQTTTDVVQKRLQDELTQKNIDDAVQIALHDHANKQIDETVQKQVAIEIDKLHPQIESTAKQETGAYLHKLYAPRKLTSQQVDAVVNTAKKLGAPTSQIFVGAGTDSESQQLGFQFVDALNAAGWKAGVVTQTVKGLSSPYGIYVLTDDPDHPSVDALKLEQCLRAAGQTSQFGKGSLGEAGVFIQPKQF